MLHVAPRLPVAGALWRGGAAPPMGVCGKVSGGSRSKRGSEVRGILMTLAATWRLRGLNTVDQCLNLIASAPV